MTQSQAKTNLFVHLSGSIDSLGETQRKNFLEELFGQFGQVLSVNIIKDPETKEMRRFCFVEMDPEGATKAIEGLDGMTTEDGIAIAVNIAKEREQRPAGNKFNNNRPRREY
jgi:RNA recognition motif-containing protein